VSADLPPYEYKITLLADDSTKLSIMRVKNWAVTRKDTSIYAAWGSTPPVLELAY
jgi:hypothetical protein